MIVLRVGLEMLGQVVDALGQDRDLDLGRTRIALGAGACSLMISCLRSAVIDIVSLLFVSQVEAADDPEAVGRGFHERDRSFLQHRKVEAPALRGTRTASAPDGAHRPGRE